MPESSIVARQEQPGLPVSSQPLPAGLRSAIALFEQAAECVPLPRAPHPIVVADYGAGDGHNALLPIGAAISALRTRTRPEHSILVTHTDIADNDFSTLFRTVAQHPDSYLHQDSAAFTSAVGRSFYSQILPSNSVHLGWSAWSVLWLGRVPMPVGDGMVVAHSGEHDVRAAYAKQAAHDWHEFVAYRGRELAPGGKVVVLTMALADDGDFGHRPLLGALADTLTELRGAGMISDDEKARMSLPIVGRSAADFVAPFAPSGRLEGLSVEHLEVFDADDRIFDRYRKDHDTKAFGAAWAAFCRFAVFDTLATVLDRPDPAFYDQLESGIAERLAAAPQQTRIPLATVVLTKKPKV